MNAIETDYVNSVINSNLKVLHKCEPLDVAYAFAFGLAEELIELHQEITAEDFNQAKADEEMGDVFAFATLTIYFCCLYLQEYLEQDDVAIKHTLADSLEELFGKAIPYYGEMAEEELLECSKKISKHFRKIATQVEPINIGLIRYVLRRAYDKYSQTTPYPKAYTVIMDANATKIINRTNKGSLNLGRPADKM